jgi:hypothetical protein
MSQTAGSMNRDVRRERAGLGIALVICALCAVADCTVISDQGVVVSQGAIGDLWDVQWNQNLGTASMMRNRSLQDVVVTRGTPAIGDSAAELAVRRVLSVNPNWLRMRPGLDSLAVVDSRSADWLRTVRFQQLYKGIPVAGAGYEARVFPSGRVGSIEGRFQPDIQLITTPAANPEIAASRARSLLVNGVFPEDLQILRFEVERFIGDSQTLVIIPWQQGLALAWAIMVENGPRERWRVYINADTGDPIGRQPVSVTWMH